MSPPPPQKKNGYNKVSKFEDLNELLLDICGVVLYQSTHTNCFEIAEEEECMDYEDEGEEIMVDK